MRGISNNGKLISFTAPYRSVTVPPSGFPPLLQRETLWLPVYFCEWQNPSKKGSTLEVFFTILLWTEQTAVLGWMKLLSPLTLSRTASSSVGLALACWSGDLWFEYLFNSYWDSTALNHSLSPSHHPEIQQSLIWTILRGSDIHVCNQLPCFWVWPQGRTRSHPGARGQ